MNYLPTPKFTLGGFNNLVMQLPIPQNREQASYLRRLERLAKRK